MTEPNHFVWRDPWEEIEEIRSAALECSDISGKAVDLSGKVIRLIWWVFGMAFVCGVLIGISL